MKQSRRCLNLHSFCYCVAYLLDTLFERGFHGLIPNFMCGPLQDFAYSVCGCGIHNPACQNDPTKCWGYLPSLPLIEQTSTPTSQPSLTPSVSSRPSLTPSLSAQPTQMPSIRPSLTPSFSSRPSLTPSLSAKPTQMPSSRPSSAPTFSSQPSEKPSLRPTLPPVASSLAPDPGQSDSFNSEPDTSLPANTCLSGSSWQAMSYFGYTNCFAASGCNGVTSNANSPTCCRKTFCWCSPYDDFTKDCVPP
jgi:hypothetical protein